MQFNRVKILKWNRLLYNVPIDPDNPPGGPGGPGGTPPPGQLPGLGQFLRRRYTCNLAVVEEVSVLDLLHDAIFPSARMFMSQGANGKIRFHNKKPVDWALGTAAFPIGAATIAVDDVSQWINNQKYFLLIDPHTNDSEIRIVTDANYSLAQNSITLTASAIMTVVGFSGCDGNNTPGAAAITVNSFVADTIYNVTLDGIQIQFIPRSSDTTTTIASFIAAAIRRHPALYRRFEIIWNGTNGITLKGKFGSLVLDSTLTKDHVAPVMAPTTAPTLTAVAGGTFLAGNYSVAYSYKNERGQTLLSPFKQITLTANQKIQVSAVTLPAGVSVVWYVTSEKDSVKLRFHSENNGSAFEITTLPKLSAPMPSDLNRTGTEVMRVKAIFSDRAEVRSKTARSNVLRGSFEWILGNREKSVNRIDLRYRNSGEDYRLVELRVRDDAHIAKTKKISNEEINGQAIDNYFQAIRIATGELAERRDADFFYRWRATRGANLLEEGDVVAITDSGSGVINLPVMIEGVEIDVGAAGLPKIDFTGRKFANTLYDDSIVERQIPVVSEI